MQKDYTFLAEDGKLTMTSAAHLRDLAALKAKELLSQLNNIRFTNKYIQLISSTERNKTQIGMSDSDCQCIPELIQQVIKYQSFEAWVNEAIEAKRNLFTELKNLSVNQYVTDILQKEMPENPLPPRNMTEDDYIATWNIKDRNRFFTLQTSVATIGKIIHRGAPYDLAIKDMQEAKTNPIQVETNGRDTLLYTNEASLSETVVNDVFFQLQNKHREIQAEFNGMKEQIRKALIQNEIENTEQFRIEYEKYQSELQQYSTSLAQYKQEERAKIEKLKIVIPQHLEDVYKELTSLGK